MRDLKRVTPRSRRAWRTWLERWHDSSPGVWLVLAKKDSGRPSPTYKEAVEEALCFGWVDSLMRTLDDRHYMQLFTPRKARSTWAGSNKARVARLVEQGLMTEAGLAAVALAKANGSWDAFDHVEALRAPPSLQRAIRANAKARTRWAALSPGTRKRFLFWLANARRDETRNARIAAIVDLVANGVSLDQLDRAPGAGDAPRGTRTNAARSRPAETAGARPRGRAPRKRPSNA
jgi:uncharacterized protein YdeI (YjbR/CyaY-like superfamily)